jgi:hypothetical protein
VTYIGKSWISRWERKGRQVLTPELLNRTLSLRFLFGWARRVECEREGSPNDNHAEAIKEGPERESKRELLFYLTYFHPPWTI